MKSQPPKKAPKDKPESKKTNGKPTPGKWQGLKCLVLQVLSIHSMYYPVLSRFLCISPH